MTTTRQRRRARAYIPVGLILVLVAALGTAAVGVGVALGAPLKLGFPRIDMGRSDTGAGQSGQQPVVEPPPGDAIPAGHVPILMYHYIRINPNPRDAAGKDLSVTPDNFAQQMQWAHDHGFRTISLGDLYTAINSGHRLDRKTMVLTFDDGYDDFYTAAWPVLRKNGFQATAYIIAGFVGRPGYLTWDQVTELDRAGVDIGAHTLTHPDLTKQTPAADQAEIGGSKSLLEQHIAHPVLDFCYPSGRFNSLVVNDVRQAGFRDATTTVPGAFESLATAGYWPRVRIEGADSLGSFTNKLASGVTDYQKYGDNPPPKMFPSPFPTLAPSAVPSSSPTDFSGLGE